MLFLSPLTFLALSRVSRCLYSVVKNLILSLIPSHHLFPITGPTNCCTNQVSCCRKAPALSSKDELNFQYPVILGQESNAIRTQISGTWDNLAHLDRVFSLTFYPGRRPHKSLRNQTCRSDRPSCDYSTSRQSPNYTGVQDGIQTSPPAT